MVIKRFIGKTEEEALELAKKELGNDLVVMNVKQVKAKGPFGSFKKKKFELTAAIEDDVKEPLRQIRKIAEAQIVAAGERTGLAQSKPVREETAPAASTIDLTVREPINFSSVQETTPVKAIVNAESKNTIEQKLDSLQNLIENQFAKDSDVSVNDDKESDERKEQEKFLKLIYNTLIDNEVDEKYANEFIIDAEKNCKSGATMDFLLATIYQKMILKFGQAHSISPAANGPKVVFFVGPTGVGKTTTIAKIASSMAINEHKRVALLTTDTYRIAATEQLRTYAGILEAPFRVAYTPDELALAVQDFSDRDYIFVDTAGHSHKDPELLASQKKFLDVLDGQAEYQSFLVLSATTKYRDLLTIVDNYKNVAEFQLIFTKLDETDCVGNLLNLRLYSETPIAYLTLGQNVPDDIEAFNAQKTVKNLLSGKK